MHRSVPQVARCEDYDSDESSVKPGTRTEARRKSWTSRPFKALERRQSRRRDGSGDITYSSQRTAAQANNAPSMPPPPVPVRTPARPATAQSTKSKPVIHRSDSQQSSAGSHARSQSASRQTAPCGQPSCQHPSCSNAGSSGRRYSTVPQYAVQYSNQYPTSPATYQQPAPQYQYAYAPQAGVAQTVPTLAAQPRPRSGSASRSARPVSVHGYSFPSAYNSSHQGPPPSQSAYQNIHYAQWAQAAAQYPSTAMYGSLAPSPTYSHPSPVAISPTSPMFTHAPPLQRTYSVQTAPTSYSVSQLPAQAPALNRTYSARQTQSRSYAVPDAYPDSREDEYAPYSDSGSSASDYDDEEYERQYRSRARDSRLMSSSSDGRPSLKKSYASAPVAPTTQHILRRRSRHDAGPGYLSSSDNVDSDRTTRGEVNRPGTTYTGSSKSSRRHSIATTASSGRTKATTVSSMSGLTSGMDGMTIERSNGRKIAYLSQRDRDAVLRDRAKREEREDLENAVHAYQAKVSGPSPLEVTADDIHGHHFSNSRSRASGHSRRSSRSASRKPGETIRIESNGTVIHVDSSQQVEIRPSEDGRSTLVIGAASGKSKKYHSSGKSTHSRGRRSQGSSDVSSRREETIAEEVGYEQSAT